MNFSKVEGGTPPTYMNGLKGGWLGTTNILWTKIDLNKFTNRAHHLTESIFADELAATMFHFVLIVEKPLRNNG